MPNPLMSVQVFAPAKINLALHVTGQRSDGYHLLDSLVAFADVGDSLSIKPSDTTSLSLHGSEAAGLSAEGDNLVLRVADLFADLPGASFVLTKTLPVASGIGGGSADAAAAFRGLVALSGAQAIQNQTRRPSAGDLLALGADIPMCVMSEMARVQGIGEQITAMPDLPALHAVLVNPRVEVSTPAVFKALGRRDNTGMTMTLPTLSEPEALINWIASQRNDLEGPAVQLEPRITAVKAALSGQAACRLARMSGSGATCFGLFPDDASAQVAAHAIATAHPDWWITAALLGTQTARARPQIN